MMDRFRCALILPLVFLTILLIPTTLALSIDEPNQSIKPHKPAPNDITEQPNKLAVITEDVITDIENTTQKVIRINPLELPALKQDANGAKEEDSSLYKIQSLMPSRLRPARRRYVNSNHMRGTKKRTKDSVPSADTLHDSPIIRQVLAPKFYKPIHRNQKNPLHFIYDNTNNALNGKDFSKTVGVRMATGEYPIYYVVSKTNGRFGKHPIKSFRTPTEFLKYLTKNKVTPIEGVHHPRQDS